MLYQLPGQVLLSLFIGHKIYNLKVDKAEGVLHSIFSSIPIPIYHPSAHTPHPHSTHTHLPPQKFRSLPRKDKRLNLSGIPSEASSITGAFNLTHTGMQQNLACSEVGIKHSEVWHLDKKKNMPGDSRPSAV